MQVFEGHFALFKLAVGKYVIDQLFYTALDSGWGRALKSPGRGFCHICEHDNARLPCLGFGSRVSEIIFIDVFIARF